MSNERKLLLDAVEALEFLAESPTNLQAYRKAVLLANAIRKELGVVKSGLYAAARGRGSLMFVAEKTKWTKFPELAMRFATTSDAMAMLETRMSTWATRHMWTALVLTEEDLRSLKVMEALR